MRFLIASAALLACSTHARAQDKFVAPTIYNIIAETQETQGSDQAHLLVVRNTSTVPVIVFGVALTGCENVRQDCTGHRLDIRIDPGTQRTVYRVSPASLQRGFTYRWTFSFHADSSDAKAMALLLANTPQADTRPQLTYGPVRPAPVQIDTSVPGVEKPLSRERLTDEERRGGVPVARRDPADTMPVAPVKFKVFYGSVLGSTMMPGAPIQLTGPCINPAEATAYEKDVKITKTPWRPPVLAPSFARLRLPIELKDSTLTSNDVLMRFAIDTTGEVIPGSVNVLESPHGIISVSACKAAIAARATPAKDKAGKVVRAWVQMPLRVGIQGT